MANVTDPLIRAVQGSDPQNLMEYITRQKIYDSRYWKEECFGLAAVDVLEKAAKLKTIGGLPTKFLCLTLKLLQLQPDCEDIIESFVQQEDFKYVRALGALYLRLTGRPDDIYNELEPLYRDYRKLRCRLRGSGESDWSLIHMDEFIHQLLTETTCVGITLPRLPARTTLQEAGYIDDGPRITALRQVLEEAGGPLQFLKLKVKQESKAAIELYEKRQGGKGGKGKKNSKSKDAATAGREQQQEEKVEDDGRKKQQQEEAGGFKSSKRREETSKKRKHSRREDSDSDEEEEGAIRSDVDDDKRSKKKKSKKEKKNKERNYGSLFKDNNKKKSTKSSYDDTTTTVNTQDQQKQQKPPPDENSEEYWNEQRAKLGLKALK